MKYFNPKKHNPVFTLHEFEAKQQESFLKVKSDTNTSITVDCWDVLLGSDVKTPNAIRC